MGNVRYGDIRIFKAARIFDRSKWRMVTRRKMCFDLIVANIIWFLKKRIYLSYIYINHTNNGNL